MKIHLIHWNIIFQLYPRWRVVEWIDKRISETGSEPRIGVRTACVSLHVSLPYLTPGPVLRYIYCHRQSLMIHNCHTLCRRPSEPLPHYCRSIRPRAQRCGIFCHSVASVAAQGSQPLRKLQSLKLNIIHFISLTDVVVATGQASLKHSWLRDVYWVYCEYTECTECTVSILSLLSVLLVY
jgi:hypothetical protein